MATKRNGIKAGTKISVEPVRKTKDINTISKLLVDSPRNHLLWIMGINNGIRAIDLVRIKVGDVANLKPGGTLGITESKTGKKNTLVINKSVHRILQKYLEA